MTTHGREAFLTGLGVGAGLMFLLDPQGGRRRRARMRGLFQHGGDGSDAVLANRVRTALGRRASPPRAIDVDVVEGCVTLRGPILRDEVDGVLAVVRGVRGVRELVDELDPYAAAGDIPSLQGQAAPRERDFAASGWTPAARLAAGTAAAMLTWGLVSRAMARGGHDVAHGAAAGSGRREEIPPAAAM